MYYRTYAPPRCRRFHHNVPAGALSLLCISSERSQEGPHWATLIIINEIRLIWYRYITRKIIFGSCPSSRVLAKDIISRAMHLRGCDISWQTIKLLSSWPRTPQHYNEFPLIVDFQRSLTQDSPTLYPLLRYGWHRRIDRTDFPLWPATVSGRKVSFWLDLFSCTRAYIIHAKC